jgi:hypothetical protein
MVSRSISGTQKDVDAKSDSAWCVAMAADGLQLSAFRVSKDELGRGWEWHTISMRPPITLVKTFQIQKTSVMGDATRSLTARHLKNYPEAVPVAAGFVQSWIIFFTTRSNSSKSIGF